MSKRKNERKPGVMVYFDLRESISMLTQSEKGDLLDAILTYGQEGLEPEFADRAMHLLWSRLRLDIQRDDDRYQEVRLRRIAAANRRWHPEEAGDALPEEQPRLPDVPDVPSGDANAFSSMQTMPATASASTPASTPAPASAAAPAPAAAPTAAAAPAPSPTPASTPAAEAAPASDAGVTAPAPLRQNGTHLPDCMSRFVRQRDRFGPEASASERQRWLEALAVLPEDGDGKVPALAVVGGAGTA